jgi:FMN-dependent NADH-azoreductase
MSLYRLDTSIRVLGSHSQAIADIVEQEWRSARPGDPVIRRHVGVDPIPATAWATAVFAGRTPPESLTEEQQAALAMASTLADELIAAGRLCEASAEPLACEIPGS